MNLGMSIWISLPLRDLILVANGRLYSYTPYLIKTFSISHRVPDPHGRISSSIRRILEDLRPDTNEIKTNQ